MRIRTFWKYRGVLADLERFSVEMFCFTQMYADLNAQIAADLKSIMQMPKITISMNLRELKLT